MGVLRNAEPGRVRTSEEQLRRRSRVMLWLPALLVLALVPSAAAQEAPGPGPPDAPQAPNACLAGTGSFGWCGDGSSARRAKLARPSDVAVTQDGRTLVADTLNQVIRRIDSTGRIATIAGSGARGAAASETSAASATLAEPAAVAADLDGSVIVADSGNNAIRRIGLNGQLTTIIRDGLSNPTDVIVLGQGRYAIADTGHNRVVVATTRGLTPIAGTGSPGFAGDGGPATAARLDGPTELSLSPQGLLVADTRNRVVRRIAADGTIATVAGIATGQVAGPTPATRRALAQPAGVVATPDGGFAVSDVGRVWAVTPDGDLRPLLGTGTPGFSPNADLAASSAGLPSAGSPGAAADGSALTTRVDHPGQLAVDPAGNVLVADTNNDRIRSVSAAGHATTLAGSDRPNAALAPVVAAPFHGPARSAPRPASRYRSRRHARARRVRVPASAHVEASARDAAPPPCAQATTRWNWLKIRPYTSTLLRSARHPVTIRFGTSIDARVTTFAWRAGHRFGSGTRQIAAGRASVRLRVTLRPGRYIAVVEGRDRSGARRCDSRKLRIVR